MSRHVRQVLARVRRRTFPRWSPHLEVAIVVALLVVGAVVGRAC